MIRLGLSSVMLLCFHMALAAIAGCAESPVPIPGDTESPSLPTLEQERVAFKPTLDTLKTALRARDAASAAATFVPEVQSDYRAIFQSNMEQLNTLADALDTATLTLVSDHEVRAMDHTICRLGDLAVTCDSIVFHVTVVKVNGVWKFKTF